MVKTPKRILVIIYIGVAVIATGLFGYLMWYVSPLEMVETVKVIAITESGCIAETLDGFPVNIGSCDASPGELIAAKVDAKMKERSLLMNPSM